MNQNQENTFNRYWQHDIKRPAHLGIRSKDYKLIYNYGEMDLVSLEQINKKLNQTGNSTI